MIYGSFRYYEVQILMIKLLWCGHLARIMCTFTQSYLLYIISILIAIILIIRLLFRNNKNQLLQSKSDHNIELEPIQHESNNLQSLIIQANELC